MASFAAAILLIQYVILIIRVKFFWIDFSKPLPETLPKVSILVSSRNEELDLPNLLKSFESIDYPSDKIEFLLADDASEDRTLSILKSWSYGQENKKVFEIKTYKSGNNLLNGKANALAIMAREATGAYFFFTDADCVVTKDWVKEGIRSFSEFTGLLNGVTEIKESGIFSYFQKLDWWNILAITKVVSDLGGHTTGLGNNMVISKEAYFLSGGYENTSFSLTEDLEISRSIKNVGFKIQQQVSSEMLLKTKAEKGWMAFLKQRKRWLKGVFTLPWFWKLALSFHLLFFPAVFYLIWLNWFLGISTWLLKIVLQSFFLKSISVKSKIQLYWIWFLFYDFYYVLATFLTILYYFWPSKITWKSRQYS
ncbi:glycosyltransferase [Algoriphagus sp.]|uniref:glycosyltransferase n=1 Tax=Algoriphagus sp. TaxID=1872435 RepID=UPI0025D652E2|nr:glycosyltransferase [Algoriphagus sp.]